VKKHVTDLRDRFISTEPRTRGPRTRINQCSLEIAKNAARTCERALARSPSSSRIADKLPFLLFSRDISSFDALSLLTPRHRSSRRPAFPRTFYFPAEGKRGLTRRRTQLDSLLRESCAPRENSQRSRRLLVPMRLLFLVFFSGFCPANVRFSLRVFPRRGITGKAACSRARGTGEGGRATLPAASRSKRNGDDDDGDAERPSGELVPRACNTYFFHGESTARCINIRRALWRRKTRFVAL